MKVDVVDKKDSLFPIFDNEVGESQFFFRQVLKVMSEPGSVISLGEHANLAVDEKYRCIWPIAQSIMDSDCTAFISPSLNTLSFNRSLSFHTGVKIIKEEHSADFVILSLDELLDLDKFNLGNLESPHSSSTLIVLVDGISADKQQMVLSGPGIKTEKSLSINNLTANHIRLIQDNHNLYPCGLDFIFCSDTKVSAIPRTTVVKTAMESC